MWRRRAKNLSILKLSTLCQCLFRMYRDASNQALFLSLTSSSVEPVRLPMMLAILIEVSRWYWDLSACQNTTSTMNIDLNVLTEEKTFPNDSEVFVGRSWHPILVSDEKFDELFEAFVSDALFCVEDSISIEWRIYWMYLRAEAASCVLIGLRCLRVMSRCCSSSGDSDIVLIRSVYFRYKVKLTIQFL